MLALFAAASVLAAEQKPPSILFILADDLGQRDLGCYGSAFYETPHLDRLAGEGARFTDAYAACPVCSPTRASIQSGQWPQRTGITDYIGAPASPDQWKRNTRSLPAPYSDRLHLETPTLAKAMKTAGYATFFAGKWHLGPEGWWPENQGFDVNMGGIDRGGPYGGKRYFSPYGNPRLPDGPEGEHLPDRLATETVRFIESNKDRPFFAFLSFYSVHTPLMARADLLKKYEEKRARLALAEQWGREHERDVRLVQAHAVYAGMVEAMDLAVGKVLAKLDDLGLARNTLVIFTSDNGGLSTSEGWPTSNLPLRAGKGWVYEGGIREPLLVRWPAKVRPGTLSGTPVSSPDFFPTLLEVAGAKSQPGQRLDGLSLLPLFEGGALPERSLFWHYPHYGNQGGAPCAAIRRGDWKLIEWLEDGRTELFNLAEDLSETNDLAARESQRVAQLRDELHAWQKQVGARSPVPNPHYDPARPSGRAALRNPAPAQPDRTPAGPVLAVAADRADATYAQGAPVPFIITLRADPGTTREDRVAWTLSKDGVPPITHGVAQLTDGRATVVGKLDEPGFLQCRVVFRGTNAPTRTAVAGAAIDPLQIQPSLPAPEDFDAFWSAQKRRLATVPAGARITPVPWASTNIECFDLEVDSLGAPVSGYYARPANASPRTLPIILLVHGAGVRSANPGAAAGWATQGLLALDLNAHGLPNGQPESYYTNLAATVLKDYRTRGRESRDTIYFLGMFLRLVRAIDFLTAQPEWDGRTLVVHGSSQGGAQAIAAAGLDSRVSFFAAGVPAMCDHTGVAVERANGWPKFLENPPAAPSKPVLEAVRYYDAMNFATRVRCPGIVTVGFIDATCPPTSVYAAYNALRGPKQIFNDPPSTHAVSKRAGEAMRAAILAHVHDSGVASK